MIGVRKGASAWASGPGLARHARFSIYWESEDFVGGCGSSSLILSSSFPEKGVFGGQECGEPPAGGFGGGGSTVKTIHQDL